MASTTKKQRLAIWIILIVLTLGTVISFLVLCLEQKQSTDSQSKMQAAYSKYEKAEDEYKSELKAQASTLSKEYYNKFSKYNNYNKAFKAKSISKLTTKDYEIGDGASISNSSDYNYSAYYIGWKPDGTVFDSSFNDGSLSNPISGSNSLVKGWSQGIVGMKIDGIREIDIPSDLAYGKTGKKDNSNSAKSIPANTPLKFIIMLIPKVDQIAEPNFQNYFSGM